MKLSDIFPNLDFNKETGLYVNDDGNAIGIDYKKHKTFLGTQEDCMFFPKEVTAICSDYSEEDEEATEGNEGFDFWSTCFDAVVITTKVDTMESIINCEGIKNFYVIDADTNEVVFHTTDFEEFEGWSFSNDAFDEFCEKLSEGITPWQ